MSRANSGEAGKSETARLASGVLFRFVRVISRGAAACPEPVEGSRRDPAPAGLVGAPIELKIRSGRYELARIVEVKEELDVFPTKAPAASLEEKKWLILVQALLANRPRACLDGRTAGDTLLSGQDRMAWYTYDRRCAMLEQIETQSAEYVRQEGAATKRTAARDWRRAVETWLLQEGIIAIEKGGSVTPKPSLSVS